MSNFDTKALVNSIRTLVKSVHSEHLREVFNETEIVVGHRQPKNLRGILTHAKFGDLVRENQLSSQNIPGIFAECKDPRCDLCRVGYTQSCSSFVCANGETWEIRCHINCNSTNVLYYQVCNMCNGKVSNTGKTKTKLRTRTNNHITCCRNGTGTNLCDRHVFECGNKNNCLKPPYFKLYAFMTVSTEEKLLTYQRFLHRRGYDTIDR